MRLNELPLWEKPREKLIREGSGRLSTTELLALLLRTGTREKSAMDLAADILSMDSRGIRFLADCTPEELRRVNGMGDAKICELIAAIELGKRIASAHPGPFERISGSQDIADIFMERMRYYRKEHFLCLLLNSKGDIIEENQVSVGDICSSNAGAREVFSSAVRRNAGSIVLIHNHPSGDPTPSDQDIRTTKQLMDAGNILGIPVLDHIIIGDGRYVSMKAEGIC